MESFLKELRDSRITLVTRVRQLQDEIGQFWWISLVGMRGSAVFYEKCL